MEWHEHQEWERQWWGNCTNTFGEEVKQITYAHRMGLVNKPIVETWPAYDLEGKNILDIGGGPTSMLLKTVNGANRLIVDPCEYPKWVMDRYEAAGITYVRAPAEDLIGSKEFDEVWIYNVLQHTINPEKIVKNALDLGVIVRLFEWVDVGVCPGHPQDLKAHLLAAWLGGPGTVEQMVGENSCWGRAFYGVFQSPESSST